MFCLLYGQIPGWVWECFWSIFRPSCEGKVCNWLLIIAKRIDLMNMLHWQQKYKAGFMSCELAGLLNTFLGCLALCHHAWQVAADLCLSFVISSPSYSINDDGKKAICGRLQWELIRADMLPILWVHRFPFLLARPPAYISHDLLKGRFLPILWSFIYFSLSSAVFKLKLWILWMPFKAKLSARLLIILNKIP